MGKVSYKKSLFLVFIILFIPLSALLLPNDKTTTVQFSPDIESNIPSDTIIEEQENDSGLELYFYPFLIFSLIFCVFSFFHFDSQIKIFQKFSFHQFSIPPPVL